MVPRGGSVNNDNDDNDDYLEAREETNIIDDSDYDDCLEGDATEFENNDDDHRTPSQISFFLSSYSSPSTLASTVVHYASVLIRVTQRACSAGARAMLHRDNENEEGCDDNDDDDYYCDSTSKTRRRPMVHTLLGRTAHVLGEMCHAAFTPPEDELKGSSSQDDDEVEMDIQNENNSEKRSKKKRRRRRRSHTRKQKQHHVCHPTKVVCNGGGMEHNQPSSSSSSSSSPAEHAILQLAKRYDMTNSLPIDTKTERLSQKYTRTVLLSGSTTLNEALQRANADARFLICYISKGGKKSDAIAIPNLLSPDAVKVMNRKPLGKKQSGDTASYYVWICSEENNSKDTEGAMKRLGVKPPTSRSKGASSSSKKKKSAKGAVAPILAIVHPSSAVDTSGKLRVVPRVLAQHHCRPPPSSPETLIAWMTSIRKRHLREYARLQHARKEMELLRERSEGYASSMKEDKAREEKEERELQLKREEEERELKRKAELEERRKALLEGLPEEPEAGITEGIMTIALRFGDGKRDQRRFVAGESSVNDVFNWIDAVHGLEREKVELSTMNGAKKFVYVEENEDGDDTEGGGNDVVLLEDAGLGKMTALRVAEIVEVSPEEEGGSEDVEEESEEEEE